MRQGTLAAAPRAVGLPGTASRRAVLRAAVWAAGALTGGLGLVERAGAATSRAAANPVVLTFLPSQSWPQPVGPLLWQILSSSMEPFLRANPGLEIRLFNNQNYQGATQAAMLAGQGPDVFSDWIMPPFVQNDLMLDLGPFIRRDNVDLSIFPPGEMSFFREAAMFSPSNPNGTYAVPAYLHTEAYAVNLTILDQLGLRYPEPDWTVADWIRLWEAVTVRASGSRKARYGTDFDDGGYDYSYNMITPYKLWGYGGEYVDPANPTRCYLTSPGSLACGRDHFNLLWEGVAMAGAGDFAHGQVVCTHSTCTCGGQVQEAQQWVGFRWDYFPDPVWPVRKSSYAASDFYGIWSGTRHPEAAWAFLKWLAFGPDWQRIVMRTALAGPNQARLWEEWATIVRQFCPPLRDKNLDAFVQPVLAGEPYFGHVFRYAEAEVKTIIGKYAALLANKRMTVEDAFAAMAREIDAAEAAGAEEAAAAAQAARTFGYYVQKAEASSAPIEYPPPPRQGPGQPAVDAPQLLQVGPAGRVALLGEGSGLTGGGDSLTFAGSPSRLSRATFVARLVSVSAAHGTGLADGAKIGLMARSDLSSTAGEFALGIAMGRGLHLMTRPFPGGQGGDNKPPAHTDVVAGQPVLANDQAALSNYLLRPIWFKLELEVDRWTGYVSLDGRNWVPAYTPFGMGFVGAWVGLFATAHGGNPVRAVFDHLVGFSPSTVVTIGV